MVHHHYAIIAKIDITSLLVYLRKLSFGESGRTFSLSYALLRCWSLLFWAVALIYLLRVWKN